MILPVAEEALDRWIEIRELPDLRLVTVIELLSPSNKIGTGRDEYPSKRADLISRTIHRVEVVLLFGGHRLPTIPIPLEGPDPDVPLDLATIFTTAYERGRYARFLDYAAPLTLPLADADRG